MTGAVVAFDDPLAQDPLLAGAKGATLAKMTGAGFPVPFGFVVSTEAFRTAVGDISEAVNALQEIESTDLDALQEASAHVREGILDVTLSGELVSEIQGAYGALGKTAVSVRSSATAEDLKHASFAGQYETFLNVVSPDSLVQCVQQVWASLYAPHAIAYCRQNGISYDRVHMAVVVQVQLEPDAAGVLFTRDPLTGAEHYVVNAAPGLGEGVVSGSVQSDRFVLRADNGHTLSADVTSKESKVVGSARGGTETASVTAQEKDQPTLTETQLGDLAGLGRQLVDLLGGPQDIEFAVTGDEIHILQSRSITAVEEVVEPDEDWEASVDTAYTWNFRSGGPMYRLEEDVRAEVTEGQRICFEETGASMAQNHIVHTANGYVFARAPAVDEDVLTERLKRHAKRIDAYINRGTSYFEGVLREIIADRLADLERQKAEVADFSDLVAYLEACVKTSGYVMGNLHWAQIRPRYGSDAADRPGFPDWHAEYHELTGRPTKPMSFFRPFRTE